MTRRLHDYLWLSNRHNRDLKLNWILNQSWTVLASQTVNFRLLYAPSAITIKRRSISLYRWRTNGVSSLTFILFITVMHFGRRHVHNYAWILIYQLLHYCTDRYIGARRSWQLLTLFESFRENSNWKSSVWFWKSILVTIEIICVSMATGFKNWRVVLFEMKVC